MTDKKTLTFMLMDPPFESTRSTTALRMLQIAAERGYDLNVLAYVTVIFVSGLVAFLRWRARRKKDRVGVFYLRVMEVRDRADVESSDALLRELMDIEREAFASLIAEKLAADESFRIFIDLLQRVRADLDA